MEEDETVRQENMDPADKKREKSRLKKQRQRDVKQGISPAARRFKNVRAVYLDQNFPYPPKEDYGEDKAAYDSARNKVWYLRRKNKANIDKAVEEIMASPAIAQLSSDVDINFVLGSPKIESVEDVPCLASTGLCQNVQDVWPWRYHIDIEFDVPR